MSHHHHEEHGTEKKEVSFTVPLILAAVTIFVILLFVSLGDPKHGHCACKEDCSKECMEACEKGNHSMHPDKAKEATGSDHETSHDVSESKEAESHH